MSGPNNNNNNNNNNKESGQRRGREDDNNSDGPSNKNDESKSSPSPFSKQLADRIEKWWIEEKNKNNNNNDDTPPHDFIGDMLNRNKRYDAHTFFSKVAEWIEKEALVAAPRGSSFLGFLMSDKSDGMQLDANRDERRFLDEEFFDKLEEFRKSIEASPFSKQLAERIEKWWNEEKNKDTNNHDDVPPRDFIADMLDRNNNLYDARTFFLKVAAWIEKEALENKQSAEALLGFLIGLNEGRMELDANRDERRFLGGEFFDKLEEFHQTMETEGSKTLREIFEGATNPLYNHFPLTLGLPSPKGSDTTNNNSTTKQTTLQILRDRHLATAANNDNGWMSPSRHAPRFQSRYFDQEEIAFTNGIPSVWKNDERGGRVLTFGGLSGSGKTVLAHEVGWRVNKPEESRPCYLFYFTCEEIVNEADGNWEDWDRYTTRRRDHILHRGMMKAVRKAIKSRQASTKVRADESPAAKNARVIIIIDDMHFDRRVLRALVSIHKELAKDLHNLLFPPSPTRQATATTTMEQEEVRVHFIAVGTFTIEPYPAVGSMVTIPTSMNLSAPKIN